MLICEVLKIRDFSKLLRLLFATPQKLLPDPPVGNHCSITSLNVKTSFRTRFSGVRNTFNAFRDLPSDYISDLAQSRLGVEPAKLSDIAIDREV